MKHFKFNYFFIQAILLVLLVSCAQQALQKPSVTGRIGEVAVVIENPQWSGELGDSIRSVLHTPYEVLPQEEKSFTILNMAVQSFNPSIQRHRNLIITSISAEFPEASMIVVPDKFAKPQTVLQITGPDERSVGKLISANRQYILDLFELAERNRLASLAWDNIDLGLSQLVDSLVQVKIAIPNEYFPMCKAQGFVWFESRTVHVNKGIFIYSYPFADDSTFTKPFLIAKRNELLKQYVRGARDSSWMSTDDYINPMFGMKKTDNQVYAELRGLWSVVNDFMGGPFISRTYVDRANKRIITVEGYIYAPKMEKRDYLRRVDGVLYSLKIE